jgi:ABC-2 type transport system ATP-binding protein
MKRIGWTFFGATLVAGSLLAGCSGGTMSGATPNAPGVPVTAGSAANMMPAANVAQANAVTDGSKPMASGELPPPTPPPNAPGVTNVVPAPPAGHTCRTGEIYNISVLAPTGDTVAFTVFEPAKTCGGQTYPLILQAPGWSGERQTALGSPAPSSTAGLEVGNNLSELVAANYGVISFDQRGMGYGTTGKIRSMDPDFEGKDYLSIMDWAQARLSWIAYAPTLDGKDPHEPIMGSIGGSYGGMYQMMLLNIDKRHRLHAITPNITPNDLSFSLYPGGVVKTLWGNELFGTGAIAGSRPGDSQYDPFMVSSFANSVATDSEDSYTHDFYGYHSVDYWCNGTTIATNGGAGTSPDLPPTTVMPKVNALVWIGVRDTLFNFDNGYRNYSCLQKAGGDVRLLSYQAGHNSALDGTVPLVPDPYVTLFYPSGDSVDSRCGSKLSEDEAQLAWFNRYLKNIPDSAISIPRDPCISLSLGDAITVPEVPTISSGPPEKAYDVGSMAVVAGTNVDVPTATTLYTAGSKGDVELGIPHARIYVTGALNGIAAMPPVVFIGLGIKHASNPTIWDLVDNNVLPLRGTGYFDVDMIGGGARLQPGDQLAFLVYGLEDQYVANGSFDVASPSVVPVTVTGTVFIPDMGPMTANI